MYQEYSYTYLFCLTYTRKGPNLSIIWSCMLLRCVEHLGLVIAAVASLPQTKLILKCDVYTPLYNFLKLTSSTRATNYQL
jgi:hypothetical protein